MAMAALYRWSLTAAWLQVACFDHTMANVKTFVSWTIVIKVAEICSFECT